MAVTGLPIPTVSSMKTREPVGQALVPYVKHNFAVRRCALVTPDLHLICFVSRHARTRWSHFATRHHSISCHCTSTLGHYEVLPIDLGGETGFYVTNACKMSNIMIKCIELRTSGLAEGCISNGTRIHIEANRVSKKLARSKAYLSNRRENVGMNVAGR